MTTTRDTSKASKAGKAGKAIEEGSFPMHEKVSAQTGLHAGASEFAEFLQDTGRWNVSDLEVTKAIAEFLGVDLVKFEEEKREMLAALRGLA